MEKEQMTIDKAVTWCRLLENDLLDSDYRVIDDRKAHLKIEALRRLIERNAEIEAALFKAEEARQDLGIALKVEER